MRGLALLFAGALLGAQPAFAQVPPSAVEQAQYDGLHAAAAAADIAKIETLARSGADVNARDGRGRTPLMVAAHLSHDAAARALIAAGADVNALDRDRYDAITIAAVADDPEMVDVILDGGGDPALVTSRYDGTALIAAAHLGHDAVVRTLIAGGAPLDHVNNLNWTALIEAIVLGDGGPRHIATLRALVEAGADIDIPDGNGVRPLTLARQRGYSEMAAILEAHGARP